MSKPLLFAATVAALAFSIAPTGAEAFSRASKLDKIAQAISKTPISRPVALARPLRSTKGLFEQQEEEEEEEQNDDEVQFFYRSTNSGRSSSQAADWNSSSNVLSRPPPAQVWEDDSEEAEQYSKGGSVKLISLRRLLEAEAEIAALFDEENATLLEEEVRTPRFKFPQPTTHIPFMFSEEESDEDMVAPGVSSAMTPRTPRIVVITKK